MERKCPIFFTRMKDQVSKDIIYFIMKAIGRNKGEDERKKRTTRDPWFCPCLPGGPSDWTCLHSGQLPSLRGSFSSRIGACLSTWWSCWCPPGCPPCSPDGQQKQISQSKTARWDRLSKLNHRPSYNSVITTRRERLKSASISYLIWSNVYIIFDDIDCNVAR